MEGNPNPNPFRPSFQRIPPSPPSPFPPVFKPIFPTSPSIGPKDPIFQTDRSKTDGPFGAARYDPFLEPKDGDQ